MSTTYRRRRLLIIECIPKWEKKNEGLVLYEFLRMTTPGLLPLPPRIKSSKQALIRYLQYKDLGKFGYVHLSGHGYAKECIFSTPKGGLTPDEFPMNCFTNKVVTLSACSLGGEDFMNRFMDRTSAKYVVAPRENVDFVEAALWYVTFYYHMLHNRRSPDQSYNLTKKALKNIGGDFKFWEWQE